ncbi:unnamed protein product [Soboliphyme baturini]|uniref:Aspartate kinase n=1 Tax=Soboliphyme baturini TaxID=241478 RepID=A0A183IEP5_9BILA|nr:unnamed protein product [Soboliphyme baturini]
MGDVFHCDSTSGLMNAFDLYKEIDNIGAAILLTDAQDDCMNVLWTLVDTVTEVLRVCAYIRFKVCLSTR